MTSVHGGHDKVPNIEIGENLAGISKSCTFLPFVMVSVWKGMFSFTMWEKIIVK